MDTSTPAYRILATYYQKTKREPLIPLGARGKLFGHEWEMIGWIIRRDVQYGVVWDEYLLFNPYYGYRWLLQNRGHWNFTTPIKDKPLYDYRFRCRDIHLDNRNYKLYYSGRASVDYVLGELYWKLQSGDSVMMKDYISPPYMLSCEINENEKNWSHSRYVEPDEVKKAFKTGPLPQRSGTAPNQPSGPGENWRTIRLFWVLYLFLLTIIQLGFSMTSANSVVLSQGFPYTPNGKGELTSNVFEVTSNKNVEFDFSADIDNSWFYFAGDIVNDATDESLSVEQTLEYYHGYDGGESWSEGSTSGHQVFHHVPPGKYYINFDYESGGERSEALRTFVVKAYRDVPMWFNYWIAVLLISVMPCYYWMSARGFEVARWSDSDFSPYASSSEGDDD